MNAAHPAGHGLQAFVRSAWALLAFQLIAAAVALAVTGWAALRVRPLLDQRVRLEEQIRVAAADVDRLAGEQQRARQEIAELERRATRLRAELQGARASTPVLSAAINAYHAGNYQDAVAKYDKALELNPGDPYIQNLKSYSQYKAGDYKGAERTLSGAMKVNPTYAWGYFDLARYECASGRHKDALKTISDAVEKGGEKVRNELRVFLAKDGEFNRVCLSIRDDLQKIAARQR